MEIPKKQYLAPMLTVVEFKIERGYVASMADQINRFIEGEGILLENESDIIEQRVFDESNPNNGYWGYGEVEGDADQHYF